MTHPWESLSEPRITNATDDSVPYHLFFKRSKVACVRKDPNVCQEYIKYTAWLLTSAVEYVFLYCLIFFSGSQCVSNSATIILRLFIRCWLYFPVRLLFGSSLCCVFPFIYAQGYTTRALPFEFPIFLFMLIFLYNWTSFFHFFPSLW